jgi:peptide/nickel transport system substrate-binding protein
MQRLAARAFGLAVGAAIAAGAAGASAQQERHLTIGFSNSITAVDPHFHNVGTNNQVNQHIFDSLIEQDEFQRLEPGLALSWTPINESTWELKLRPGVKFHDGSDFDAQDVAATFRRAPNVPNSPSSFAIYTRPVKEVKVVDPMTVHLITDGPYPLLPNDISNVYVISDRFEGASTDDFNSGRAAVGTGPYRLQAYVPGERVVMTRNDAYWRGAEPWNRVEFRIITQAAARVAALLAGDVDIIDQVPTADIASLGRNQNVRLVSAPSNRVIYFHMDHQDRQTPFVTAKDGSPLAKNPLTDVRVRRALSMAINRPAISERVMEGQAIPAGQFLPEDFFGTSKNLPPMAYDPQGARRLLAEAGFPNGFRMTIHGPNDRYINSPANLQAVAQMFTRIGVDTTVEALPWATYSAAASRQDYSFFLVGWGSGTGETSSPLRSLVATVNRDTGMGPSNRGRYSNPEMDAVLAEALRTIDDAKRAELLAKASELAINGFGIIPLHYEVSTWGMRRSLTYVGRADQYTLAMSVRPAQQ